MTTPEEFKKCILDLHELSKKIKDNWNIHNETEEITRLYVTKRETKYIGETWLEFEYHVTYSVAYSVPVLCFRVWKTDGCVLNVDDIWSNCHFSQKNINLSYLSQLVCIEHAVLRQPFITLHPCKTAALLETFQSKSKNIVVSWLSVIGPVVHLHLLPEYFSLT